MTRTEKIFALTAAAALMAAAVFSATAEDKAADKPATPAADTGGQPATPATPAGGDKAAARRDHADDGQGAPARRLQHGAGLRRGRRSRRDPDVAERHRLEPGAVAGALGADRGVLHRSAARLGRGSRRRDRQYHRRRQD